MDDLREQREGGEGDNDEGNGNQTRKAQAYQTRHQELKMTGRTTAVVLALAVIACTKTEKQTTDATKSADSTTTALGPGEAYLNVPGGRIWYRKSGSGNATPVIL